jgi:endonuclease/exonuclease/phosphatase family metal-dependent hydrolase
MTRNVYVGTTTEGIMMAQDPMDIPLLATEAFQLLQATNFPERAYSLAREIKRTKPHLIGLQEISLVRTQVEGDFFTNPGPNAEDVMYDYLQILMQALTDYNLKYQVAGVLENFDVEIPMVVDFDKEGAPIFGDIRLTDYDVVLTRVDVEVANVVEENYQTNLYLEDLKLEVLRGYVAFDAKVGHKKLRFVSTHLEAFTGDPEFDYFIGQIQLAQAMELVGTLSDENQPVVIVGDFNSPAPVGDTYQYILSEGYNDAWEDNHLKCNPDGFTFGHDADLMNRFADFDERIDFVFTRHPSGDTILPARIIVVGDEYRNRTSSGLWPSDHGGVVAKLKIPFADRLYVHRFK